LNVPAVTTNSNTKYSAHTQTIIHFKFTDLLLGVICYFMIHQIFIFYGTKCYTWSGLLFQSCESSVDSCCSQDQITGGLEAGLGYRLVSVWELVVSIKEGEVVVG